MAYSDRVVGTILEEVCDGHPAVVLDPFCGSGTTLVEAKLRGHVAVGVDANPACVFFSQVKTAWNWDPATLWTHAEDALADAARRWKHLEYAADPRYTYASESGMILRGWITAYKLSRIISLLRAIDDLSCRSEDRRALRAAAIASVRERLADVGFGPELYCLKKRRRTRVTTAFLAKVRQFMADKELVAVSEHLGEAHVIEADARNCHSPVLERAPYGVDVIVTSPPYPNEHDYTRNTRLELVLLGEVVNLQDLRCVKKRLIRSTTKGLYIDDSDADQISGEPEIIRVASELDRRSAGHRDGFSQLYGRLILEYFGGMDRHLISMRKCLRPGGLAFYVLSDQECYLGVHVDTPRIVETLATGSDVGFESLGLFTIARRRGTTGTRLLRERLLVLRG